MTIRCEGCEAETEEHLATWDEQGRQVCRACGARAEGLAADRVENGRRWRWPTAALAGLGAIGLLGLSSVLDPSIACLAYALIGYVAWIAAADLMNVVRRMNAEARRGRRVTITRTRAPAVGEDAEAEIDFVHAWHRVWSRRLVAWWARGAVVLALTAGAWWLALIPVFVHTERIGSSQGQIGIGIALALGALASTIAAMFMLPRVARGDTQARPPLARHARIVVLRRFTYALDLQSMSTLLPALWTLGRPAFVRNPSNTAPTGIADDVTFAPDPYAGPTHLSGNESFWRTFEGDERYDERRRHESHWTRNASLLSQFFLHPSRYIANIPTADYDTGHVEVLSIPGSGWVSGVRDALERADFAVIDLTGANDSIEVELGLAQSLLPHERILLVCRAPRGYPPDRVARVGPLEVFLYRPSLWGSGDVAGYLISRIERGASQGTAAIAPAVTPEVAVTLRQLGAAGFEASRRVPLDVHQAFLTGLCAIVAAGAIALATKQICALAGVPIVAIALLLDYAQLIRRWRSAT